MARATNCATYSTQPNVLFMTEKRCILSVQCDRQSNRISQSMYEIEKIHLSVKFVKQMSPWRKKKHTRTHRNKLIVIKSTPFACLCTHGTSNGRLYFISSSSKSKICNKRHCTSIIELFTKKFVRCNHNPQIRQEATATTAPMTATTAARPKKKQTVDANSMMTN